VTRPFGLRDVGLLWALRGQGITLDMQRAILGMLQPLPAALTALLLPPPRPGGTLTFVGQDEGEPQGGRFLQVLTCPARQEWQVIHLAPWVQSEDLAVSAGWVAMLEDLCVLAGQQGALRVRAGMPAGGSEEDAFRQAGFTVYAREEVYQLAGPLTRAERIDALRPVAQSDAWPLTQLVGQVVPSPVQHAEGMISAGAAAPAPILTRLGVSHEQGYVADRGTDLGAYVGLSRTGRATWARILLHPEMRKEAPVVMHQLVRAASPGPTLYCAVRDYQAGLRGVLAGMGFEFVGVQVWLVKHTARPIECRSLLHLVAYDKRGEPVTTPLHPVNGEATVACLGLAREHCVYEYRRRDGYAVGSN